MDSSHHGCSHWSMNFAGSKINFHRLRIYRRCVLWKVNKRLRDVRSCVWAPFSFFNPLIRNGNSDRENILLDSFINLFTLRDDDDQVKTLRFLKTDLWH
ncbi:hypothetical protein CDAR_269091 [Caerostris darwini]|uniref:Uncharacterized protein n=1 Tax=Caerostris darwini TaxID=1538125 RepID=A0AAV4WYH3_9ARAC|nr:hypothetical protein CDAR_269091 [Caerostris darwini]